MISDLDQLRQWIGRTETGVDYVTIASVHRLSATLDRAKLWVVERSRGCRPFGRS
jgi:hypothetical protein